VTRKSGVGTAPTKFKPAKALYFVLETPVNRKTAQPRRGDAAFGKKNFGKHLCAALLPKKPTDLFFQRSEKKIRRLG